MKTQLIELKKKCSQKDCKNRGLSKHSCPYDEDINGDPSKKCNCCTDCTNVCADDI